MMKTGVQKATVIKQERVPQPKKAARSHRIELVIARIFAKRRASMKEPSFRQFDVEEARPSWD